MRDNTDYAALRRELALLCCQQRGLNPDHVAPGATVPAWQSDEITSAVGVMLRIAGSSEAARRHVEIEAAQAA